MYVLCALPIEYSPAASWGVYPSESARMRQLERLPYSFSLVCLLFLSLSLLSLCRSSLSLLCGFLSVPLDASHRRICAYSYSCCTVRVQCIPVLYETKLYTRISYILQYCSACKSCSPDHLFSSFGSTPIALRLSFFLPGERLQVMVLLLKLVRKIKHL